MSKVKKIKKWAERARRHADRAEAAAIRAEAAHAAVRGAAVPSGAKTKPRERQPAYTAPRDKNALAPASTVS